MPRDQHPRVAARDRALRRLQRLTLLATAGGAALAGTFAGLAAHAAPGRSSRPNTNGGSSQSSAASSSSSPSQSPTPPSSSSSSSPAPAPSPPASAPTPSYSPPPVVSGGS